MKKFIKILLWVLAIIIFTILLVSFLINNKPLQKKISSKYFKTISFKKIRILPGKILITNLNIGNDNMDLKNFNAEIRFNIFKLASWKVKKVKLSLDSVKMILPQTKMIKEKKKLTRIELPILPKKIPDIKALSIHIKNIIIEKIAKVNNVNIYGNISDGKLNIKSDKILFSSKEYKSSASLKFDITGKLYKDIDLVLIANAKYDTYNLSCNIPSLHIDLDSWEIRSGITLKEKDLGKIIVKDIKITPFENKIDLKIGHLYTGKLKIDGFLSGLNIEQSDLNLKNIDAEYYLNNNISVKSGNVYLYAKGNYVNENMLVSNANIAVNMNVKNNNLFLDSKINSSGSIKNDTFLLKMDTNGKVKDILVKQIIDISSNINGYYKNNRAKVEISAKGNKNNIKSTIDIDSNINEKIKDIFAKAHLRLYSEQKYGKDGLKGSSKININVHKLEMPDMNITGQELAITLGNKTNFNTLSISLGVLNNYVDGNISANVNLKNKDIHIKNSALTLFLSHLPLKMFNIKNIEVNKGIANIYVDSMSLKNSEDIQGDLKVALNDLVLEGMNLEKLYMPLLTKNIIQISINGNIRDKNFQGLIDLNSEKSNLFAKFKLNYNSSGLSTIGNITFDSKRLMIPIYEPFLLRGKVDLPIDLKLLNNRDIYAKGKLNFDNFYVSSPDIKINRLSGDIPIDIDLNKIFKQSIPSVMEKPIVDITPIEKIKANLTIGRLYLQNYEISNMNFNITFNNYLNIDHFSFRFARGVGNGSLKYVLSNKFWLAFNFTNGYVYELLKTAPKGFSKDDTKVNIHSLIYGNLTELNGYVKMPGLGRSVLLNILYMVDPDNKDPQIQSLTSKVKFFGYYPKTIELKLDGSTMSIYVPLKKRGLNPLNIPFSIQNIPIKKLLKSMSSKGSEYEED